MVKKGSSEGVYRVTEVIGTSRVSWEDAAKNAVTAAGKTLRDLRIAEVSKLDLKVEDGKVVAYRARVQLSCNSSRCETNQSRTRSRAHDGSLPATKPSPIRTVASYSPNRT